MIFTLTLTPALDKTVTIPSFALDKVNRIETIRLDPGGKGINVSKTLQALGCESVAAGILGGRIGESIREAIEGMGIQCEFVSVAEETRTNLKIIDPVNHTNTDINEPGSMISEEILNQLLERILNRIQENDIVVLAGKAPPGASEHLFEDWCRRFMQKGAMVCMDADDVVLKHGILASPTLIKPNREELSRLMDAPMNTHDDILRAAQTLIRRGIQTVVVSLGSKGAMFVREDQILVSDGLRVPVRSTVGAGDAMMAAMCCGMARKMSFYVTCRLAIAVSAAAVTCSGTQPPSLETIESLLTQVRPEPYQSGGYRS